MYHIFLALSLIIAKEPIEQIEKQINKQVKIYSKEESVAINKPEVTPLTSQENNSNPGNDIIAQLESDLKTEEKSLKIDLESLGLDLLEDIETPQIQEIDIKDSIKTSPFEEEAKEEVKEETVKEEVTKEEVTKEEVTKEEVTKEEVTKEEDKFQELLKNVKEINTKKSELEIIKKEAKLPFIVSKKDNKNKITQKKISEKNTQIEDTSKANLTSQADSSKKNGASNQIIKEKEEVKNYTENNEEELENQESSKMLQKIQFLRKQYLQEEQVDYGNYDGIENYQTMKNIIPKKRVPPKFINTDVPPPLKNRFKTRINKHHPIILSGTEKIALMFDAIAQDRIEDFNSLFEVFKNPNIRNSKGDTLLTFSILTRRFRAVSALLSKGANADLANHLGYTPMNIAIEMADYPMVALLVNMGARIDSIDPLGRTYLMQAVRVGSLPIVELLVNNGVDVNTASNNEETALSIAYKHKKDIVTKFLLQNNAVAWKSKKYIKKENSMVNDLFYKW